MITNAVREMSAPANVSSSRKNIAPGPIPPGGGEDRSIGGKDDGGRVNEIRDLKNYRCRSSTPLCWNKVKHHSRMRSTDVDIAEWLRGLGLEDYERTLRDHEIDLEILLDLGRGRPCQARRAPRPAPEAAKSNCRAAAGRELSRCCSALDRQCEGTSPTYPASR